MSPRPPIRIVTRLLAELQTSIIAAGLPLTDGDIDRFAILSLIAGRANAPPGGSPLSIKSLSDSLSKPYETVRRQVAKLVATGLCTRAGGGVTLDPAGAARMAPISAHVHDAFVRFVADLVALEVSLPPATRVAKHDPAVGIAAAADIMLTVLDGNRGTHREWQQLVVFSAVLAVNVDGFARDPARARQLADERSATPADWLRPVRAATIVRMLGLPETTVRRQLAGMAATGIVAWREGGYVIDDAWLDAPSQVAVSRASYANVRRVLARAEAAGFPLHDPASAYLNGRPADATAR